MALAQAILPENGFVTLTREKVQSGALSYRSVALYKINVREILECFLFQILLLYFCSSIFLLTLYNKALSAKSLVGSMKLLDVELG